MTETRPGAGHLTPDTWHLTPDLPCCSRSPTEGSESWLVGFSECEGVGRPGVVTALHDNKFFQVWVDMVRTS